MKAIITVVGPDRVGIIAEVCTLLAELHISVVEISQTIMEGTFTMIMLTQWTAGAPEFDVVQSRIAAKGDEMGLSSACSGRISSRPCTPSDREESHAEPL